ncbi:hypothetical protein DS909_03665 [Phaeobacter gallaeciensis]|uniref:EamA domain-containing protein n=2 Tax=Roseobacteraceae TaxID=2854170 RepID=A0A366X5Y8_9RHOB|nr:hypothetical protein DS909_03665 [Phaeobacter gallaeciensis]
MQAGSPPVMAYVVMALGATGLTLGDFFIKKSSLAGVSLPALMVFSWPFTVAALLVLAHLKGGIRHHLYPHAPGRLLIRAVLLLVMATLNITSLMMNPYAQHAMLFQLSPVFALLISVLVLGERLSAHVIVVLVTCLAGTWLILDPGFQGISATLLIAVAAALSNAVTNTFVAVNRTAATPLGFTFWAVNGVSLVIVPWWLLADRSVPALNAQMFIQLSAGFAVLGIILASLAMQLARGNIGRISIMLYVQMPVALGLGWLALGEYPPQSAILGGILIGLAGASVPLMGRRHRERAPT